MKNKAIDLLVKRLNKKTIDGILITKEQNCSYLSGFTGSDSSLFITPSKKFFLTDSRYTVQAKRELEGFELIECKKPFFRYILQLCKDLKVKRLGFESTNLSFDQFSKLKKLVGKVKFIPTIGIVEDLRKIKTKEELLLIKNCINVTLSCLNFIKKSLKAGLREKDFAAMLDNFIKTKGGDRPAFDTIVASGANSIMPHSIVSSRKITKDDSVLVDFGVRLCGYNSDLTRVFSLGKINVYYKKLYKSIIEAQRVAIEKIKPGVRACDIELSVRNFLKAKGLEKFFGHSLGHGVGREVHELPRISTQSKEILQPNMVFTIEPGIYIPNLAGFRKEDMVVVTKSGCEVLTEKSLNIR